MKLVKLVFPIMFLFVLFATIQTKAQDEKVFKVVENMPEFQGGDLALRKYISQNVKYPETAKKEGIQGKVYVTFIVSKDGTVKQARIARGVDPSLDKEAIRVVSALPKWKPGSQRGTAVNVEYTVPINFVLNGDKPKESKNSNQSKDLDKMVFRVVEDMPEFPGGDMALRKYIAQNVKYPEKAKKEGIKGKVFVSFVVGRDGQVKDAKIARGVDPSLDQEALRVINTLPKWKPGSQRGTTVNVEYTVPINFALN